LRRTKKTANARIKGAAERLCRLNSRQAKTATNASPAHDETPERIFERRQALSVLDRVVEKLDNEFVHHGRPEHFERLKVFLIGQSDAPYAGLAREMNTSEGALKVAIHGLRKSYRDIFARKSRIQWPSPRK
jgi:hypothetical protein